MFTILPKRGCLGMFGFVMADSKELSEQEKQRYSAVYCGICRQIRKRTSQVARLALSYDMAFLALLHMSLYEPEEAAGKRACLLHPIKPRPWVDNRYIQYAADMNVALSYYNARDDWQDDRKLSSGVYAALLKKRYPKIADRYPRQCQAIVQCITQLQKLEAEGCTNPDLPAGCFGQLMAELMVYEEDQWSATLRKLGQALGRFIYLADAAVDYQKDFKKKRYNPFIAMGAPDDQEQFKQYLIMAMGRCTRYYESLPLVQDKKILDNILYGGVWLQYGRKQGKEDGGNHDS